VTIVDAVRDRMPHYTCPLCNRGLRGSTVTLVSESDETANVRIVCAHCKASFVIVLTSAEHWGDEAQPVTVTEVVAVHDALETWEGNLTELLDRRRLGPGATFKTDEEPRD
jgi:hypothetical protein